MERERYSKEDSQYILNHFRTMTCEAIGKSLGRTGKSINQKLCYLRRKNSIGARNNNYASEIIGARLLSEGKRNNFLLRNIRATIQRGLCIDLMVEDKKEKCLIEYKNSNYFSVKRKNYSESYNYSDLLQGTITIME